MNRHPIAAILVLTLVVIGSAAVAHTRNRADHRSSEWQVLETLHAQGELHVAERARRLTGPRPNLEEVSAIQELKRQTWIDLLEAKQSFARERGDLKTEADAEAALRFWRGPAAPMVSESPQPFDKNEGDQKP